MVRSVFQTNIKKAFGMKLAGRLALQVVKLKPHGAGMLLTLWHEFIF